MKKCSNCGKTSEDFAQVCMFCGARFPSQQVQTVYQPVIIQQKKESKTGLYILIAAFCVFAVVVGGFLIKNAIDNKKAEEAEEISISEQESLSEYNEMSRQAAAAEQASLRENHKESYAENFNSVYHAMIDDLSEAESCGKMILSVWHNSIFQTEDVETDIYTKDANGVFYEDFNDALEKLMQSQDFSEKMTKIKNNQTNITATIMTLTDPPKEYSEYHNAIKTFYSSYLAFTNIVLNPTGSYQQFSSSFNEANTTAFNDYSTLNLLLETQE